MTSHDVMEATLFKKSLSRGSELQSSRACSMEIKTGFVVHILMLIVGGKTKHISYLQRFRLYLWLNKVALWVYLLVTCRLFAWACVRVGYVVCV